jgi:hypothetical protein
MNSFNSICSTIKQYIVTSTLYDALASICKPANTDVLIDMENGSLPPTNVGTKMSTPYSVYYNNGDSLFQLDSTNKKFGSYALTTNNVATNVDNTKCGVQNFVLSTTTGFSYSVWFRYTALPASNFGSILTSDTVSYFGRTSFIGAYFNGTSGQINVQCGWKDLNTNLIQTTTASTYGVSNNGSWNHLAFSVSNNGTCTLSINGSSNLWTAGTCMYLYSQQANIFLADDIKTYNFYLGRSSSCRYVFNGTTDQMRLYNYTLSVSEMQSIYSAGC